MTEPTVTASPAVLLREAASKMRELAQAATPGPWRHGDNQCIAGVVMEGFGEAHCAGCRYGEPSWIGRRDINGTRMLAHVHTQTEAWWEHGIFAERPDGHVVVVNDTDEYGYMTDGDARHIAAWPPEVALAVADWLDEAAVRHRPRQNASGLPDACPDCVGGLGLDDPQQVRSCGCWGLSEPICGTCAQDGTAVRRYPTFWPCADYIAALYLARVFLGTDR